jgi:hypothetical protein
VWILAIPDKQSAREKLLLAIAPAEAEAVPLSPHEVEHFCLGPGEIRRVL